MVNTHAQQASAPHPRYKRFFLRSSQDWILLGSTLLPVAPAENLWNCNSPSFFSLSQGAFNFSLQKKASVNLTLTNQHLKRPPIRTVGRKIAFYGVQSHVKLLEKNTRSKEIHENNFGRVSFHPLNTASDWRSHPAPVVSVVSARRVFMPIPSPDASGNYRWWSMPVCSKVVIILDCWNTLLLSAPPQCMDLDTCCRNTGKRVDTASCTAGRK